MLTFSGLDNLDFASNERWCERSTASGLCADPLVSLTSGKSAAPSIFPVSRSGVKETRNLDFARSFALRMVLVAYDRAQRPIVTEKPTEMTTKY